jgi:hypothetical protein
MYKVTIRLEKVNKPWYIMILNPSAKQNDRVLLSVTVHKKQGKCCCAQVQVWAFKK